MRGVYEREKGSGVWWIHWHDHNSRCHREKAGPFSAAKLLYGKRKTDALLRRKLPELYRGRVSFDELAKDALKYSRTHKRSFHDDEVRLAKILPFFAGRPADSISAAEVQDGLAKLNGIAPATYNRYRSLISLVFRVGMQSGKITTNPARQVPARKEHNARIRWLTEEEEAKLREHISAEHELELTLALHTGLRKGELYALTRADVDIPNRLLTVRKTKTGPAQHIPLNVTAIEALQKLMTGNQRDRVFRVQNSRFWFEKAVEDSGLTDLRFHDLRHTFASRLVQAGVHLRTVQELMRHKSIAMTVRYSHLAPGSQQKAVELLSGVARTGTKKIRNR